jgi:WS/DGAT/MGAT family acyltransferase
MDRLSALDASFLYGETPESPMHVAGLAIFEPPPAGSDVFAVFRDHLTSRLHLVPFFERKLALTPIQLDHPVWVHDDNLDLDYHFRHVSLPKPGTREQLETLVARLHMILLDRSRPLWQYYVIEGLEGGGFAVYIKMHHAGIDGGAGMAALPVIFATSPDPEPAPPPSPSPRGSRIPEIFELISDSYAKFFTQQRE